MKRTILLTGEPKIGKSTTLKGIVTLLGTDRCGGFITEEKRENGERTGFVVKTIDGKEGEIASIYSSSDIRVGKYGVNLDEFAEIGVQSINKAISEKTFVIIDEIGPMQLFSESFKRAVMKAIKSKKTVIGTVVLRQYEWVDELKQRSDIELVELTMENRNLIAEKIANEVTKE